MHRSVTHLLVLIGFASTLALAEPGQATFLWSYSPQNSTVSVDYSILTPNVWAVQVEADLVGLDTATGKQRWTLSTDGLKYCPGRSECYFGSALEYDPATDLIFVVILADQAPTVSVIAFSSSNGTIKYSIAVPVDPDWSNTPVYFLDSGSNGQLHVWDGYQGILHTYAIANGNLLWSSNATDQSLCKALASLAGVASSPQGDIIAYCGIYSYWAWDSTGNQKWINPGNGTIVWAYGPTFLPDGSFLIWQQTPNVIPCRYASSSSSFNQIWCSNKSTTYPIVWGGASMILLNGTNLAVSLTANDSSSELVLSLQTFNIQSGSGGWGGQPIIVDENEFPQAYSPVALPTSGTIYYAPENPAYNVIYVINPQSGAIITTQYLPDEMYAVAASDNAVYMLSSSTFYAFKPVSS